MSGFHWLWPILLKKRRIRCEFNNICIFSIPVRSAASANALSIEFSFFSLYALHILLQILLYLLDNHHSGLHDHTSNADLHNNAHQLHSMYLDSFKFIVIEIPCIFCDRRIQERTCCSEYFHVRIFLMDGLFKDLMTLI